MGDSWNIKELIPHRDPFLLVDEIVSFTSESETIITKKNFPASLEVFAGHYPDNPIVPGVLLCETIFQSGALLMALLEQSTPERGRVPVLTRIGAAKFKRFAEPDETVEVEVQVLERIAQATRLKGKMRIAGKVAVQVEFTCALVEKKS